MDEELERLRKVWKEKADASFRASQMARAAAADANEAFKEERAADAALADALQNWRNNT